MNAVRGVVTLLLAGWILAMNHAAQAAFDPGTPCAAGTPEPPPAYPLPLLTAREIAAMFAPPRTNAQLLSNLKTVLDRKLLAQPAFFEDEVLRNLFNTHDIQWVEPGTPGAVAEHIVRPTRIALIHPNTSNNFAAMTVHVGMNHKCLERRPHPERPGTFIPAHTYDSGYIYMQLDGPAAFTIGDVRRVFGWSFAAFSSDCRGPSSMSYQGPEGPSRDAFSLHEANFRPSEVGYFELCKTAPNSGAPEGHPVGDVWVRLVEQDYTRGLAVTP